VEEGPRSRRDHTLRVLVVDGPEADWPVIARALGRKGFTLLRQGETPSAVRTMVAPPVAQGHADGGVFHCVRTGRGAPSGVASSVRRYAGEPRPEELTAGTLAAGVAHEINNPLAAVIANLDLALSRIDRLTTPGKAGEKRAEPPLAVLAELRAELHDAQEAAGHVREVVRAVRAFCRPEDEETEAVDVREVVELALRMASNEVRRARLVRDLGRTPAVRTTPLRLGQVFVNLLVNAAQAIDPCGPRGQEIHVATGTDERGWANISISDTGVGIAEENLARVFVPFFTTKPAGIGSGLGLPICQRIVEELGGRIDLKSRLGYGTTVTVILPPASPRD
jgi:signal transduction histidine kinase